MPNNINYGSFCVRQAGLLIPVLAAAIDIATTSDRVEAQQFPTSGTGNLQVAEVLTTSSTTTITTSIQAMDPLQFSLLFGQKSAGETLIVPTYNVVTVPAAAPYTVTITGLTENQVVEVSKVAATAPGSAVLTQTSAPGTPTATSFVVTANTITFDASLAGQSVAIYYKSSQVLTEGFGGNLSGNELGDMELFCKYRSTRHTAAQRLWFPSVSVSGDFNLSSGGDDIPIVFTAKLPPGFNKVFKVF